MANIALYPGGYKPPHIGHFIGADEIVVEQRHRDPGQREGGRCGTQGEGETHRPCESGEGRGMIAVSARLSAQARPPHQHERTGMTSKLFRRSIVSAAQKKISRRRNGCFGLRTPFGNAVGRLKTVSKQLASVYPCP